MCQKNIYIDFCFIKTLQFSYLINSQILLFSLCALQQGTCICSQFQKSLNWSLSWSYLSIVFFFFVKCHLSLIWWLMSPFFYILSQMWFRQFHFSRFTIKIRTVCKFTMWYPLFSTFEVRCSPYASIPQ